jgi:hypothetical protein
LKKSAIYVLIALMLALGAALVACGGGGNNNKAAPTAAGNQQGQQATPSGGGANTPTGNSGSAGGSIGDVPVYPGANKTTGGEWSGSNAAIPAIGSSVNAADYKTVQYAMYETSDGADKVLSWYKDKMSSWSSQGTFSGGDTGSITGFAAWTKDDGKEAAWITAAEDSGTTTLGIFFGSQ